MPIKCPTLVRIAWARGVVGSVTYSLSPIYTIASIRKTLTLLFFYCTASAQDVTSEVPDSHPSRTAR